MAHTARTPQLKAELINLSQNWLKLAIDLEQGQQLLDEWGAKEGELTRPMK